ncbi:MAG: hypothetical protein OEY01_03705 [Desulfobulbaceae bacterium]|nr:hypothetical protein [Desulfobulbaceae bacterium]
MSTKRYLIEMYSGEHFLWKEGDNYLLSDHSGKTPEETEDGPLHIQATEMIEITKEGHWLVPVWVERTGEKSRVSVGVMGGMDLAIRLRMKVSFPVLGGTQVATINLFDTLPERDEDCYDIS